MWVFWSSFVTYLQEAGKRIACPKKSKKDPVTTEMLIDLLIRDLSMILLCFAGFLRYDEISSLLCNNVKIYDEYFTLFIEKAKNRPV